METSSSSGLLKPSSVPRQVAQYMVVAAPFTTGLRNIAIERPWAVGDEPSKNSSILLEASPCCNRVPPVMFAFWAPHGVYGTRVSSDSSTSYEGSQFDIELHRVPFPNRPAPACSS